MTACDPPPGLLYVPDALEPHEEATAIAVLETLEYRQVVMHGQPAKRVVRHFGVGYDYGSRSTTAADPLPADLTWLRERCAETSDVGVDELAEVLVTRYPPGAGIGWHRDAPAFGQPVVGVSLGSPCVMRFRRRDGGAWDVRSVELAPRSIYAMRGPSRWSWQHGIRATPQLRYSVTFRTLRSKD